MSHEHELPSDSDEDDEDYVPDGAEALGSEVESEGDAESGIEDDHDENEQITNKKRGKQRRKKVTKRRKVVADGKDSEEEKEKEKEEEEEVKKVLTEEEEKKKADSLWADFMKDTGSVSKPQTQKLSTKVPEKSSVAKPSVDEKVKITKVFEFAGEEVKVEEEVSANSVAARLALSSTEQTSVVNKSSSNVSAKKASAGVGIGGICSVLGQIGKKAKISTLEKSKLDWASFKKEENLDEEINTHNRGKDGYLDRQDFLQRADLRQFEIEKQLRTTTRRSNR